MCNLWIFHKPQANTITLLRKNTAAWKERQTGHEEEEKKIFPALFALVVYIGCLVIFAAMYVFV